MYSSIKSYWLLVIGGIVFGCAERQTVTQKPLYNIDSVLTAQVSVLKKHELKKSVTINGKNEDTKLTPDSLQWADELEIFKAIDQVNKASFRSAYVVNDTRDTNSNLMIREIKAQGEVPVSFLKLYFLKSLKDVRKIEASLVEDNSLYTDTRKLTLEFERSHVLQKYRIEGSQKMVMNDSVNFVIEGAIE